MCLKSLEARLEGLAFILARLIIADFGHNSWNWRGFEAVARNRTDPTADKDSMHKGTTSSFRSSSGPETVRRRAMTGGSFAFLLLLMMK
jgi:hypothetical protein